jgi:ABC-2 type transport system ATP-binding protein
VDAAIEAIRLSKAYRDGTEALCEASFTIAWGEIFAYLGRNAAGKTTTVRVLTTLARPTSGEARVAGFDVRTEAEKVRQRIGVTMQNATLDDLMTGREHLDLAARLAHLPGDRRRAVDELLEVCGLVEVASRKVASYSGGMRRRLDLAMALVTRPKLLFLDEPTTGLDAQSRRALWALVRQLRHEGGTVFLTTQYLEEADELADRVAIIDAGRIVAEGTSESLKRGLGSTMVKLRLGHPAPEAVRWLERRARVEILSGGWLRVLLTGEHGQNVLDLLAGMRDHGVVADRLTVSEPTLEDVFVGLTGTSLESTTSASGEMVASGRRAMGIAKSRE